MNFGNHSPADILDLNPHKHYWESLKSNNYKHDNKHGIRSQNTESFT